MVAVGVLLPWLSGRLLEEGMVLVAAQGGTRKVLVLVTLTANGRDGVRYSSSMVD
jgi:hypothetical protein